MNSLLKRKLIYLMIAAVIIVLQIVSTYITFGSFPITLTLIPITLSGLLFGKKIGILEALVFGIYVAITCIFGIDAYGATLFSIHPFIITITVLIKPVIGVVLAVFTFNHIKNKKAALFAASCITPLVNTLVLELSLIVFFDTTIVVAVSTFISINVLIELLANVVLVPILFNTFKDRVI